MSNTYKTNPWRVKILEAHTPEEVHDHRFGECDLLSKEEWVRFLAKNDEYPYRCTWYIRPSQRRKLSDGCELCVQQEDRKIKTKRTRHKQHVEDASLKRTHSNPLREVEEE